MKFNINIFNKKQGTIPLYGSYVWVTENDFRELCKSANIENYNAQNIYICIKCNHIAAPFTIYSRVCSTNDDVVQQGTLWIHNSMISKRIFVNQGQEVDVTVIDIQEFPVAESVSIKLQSDEVKKWSSDDVDFATRFYRSQNQIVFIDQPIHLLSQRKDNVIGVAESTHPINKKNNEGLCRINHLTKIAFHGLPENLSKEVDLSDIGGLPDVIDRIRSIIQIPLNYSEYLDYFGTSRPKGLLLYGPPGNGKTMIARAIAKSMGADFVEINITDTRKGIVGQGEAKLRAKFAEAESRGNGVIFIDEIDSISQARTDNSAGHEVSIVGTLLSLMDGLGSSNVFVIGATNRPDAVDPALRRTGRFDLEIEIPLPNLAAREDILLKHIPIANRALFAESITNQFIKRLAELTSGYSGSDIKALYREAVMNAIREHIVFCEDTGKYFMESQPSNIVLEPKHFLDVVASNVPSALRGLELKKEVVDWDNLLALDAEKLQMESLHNKLTLVNNLNSSNLLTRPSFANVLITGERGTGKHTFISSFARHFEYEMFELDFISLGAMDITEAYRTIDVIFSKCRQITPSVIVLSNIDKVQSPIVYIHKVLNEMNRIAKHLQIFMVCICEDESLNEYLKVYKGFSTHLNFNKDDQYIKKCLSVKYELPESSIVSYKRIGEALSEIHEYYTLNKSIKS